MQCGKLAKILRAVSLPKPIEPALLEHARKCDCCFFWLSFTLALNKAYFGISRLRDGSCPPRIVFRYLLRSEARNANMSREQERSRDMRLFRKEEAAAFAPFRDHICGCPNCECYYGDLAEAVPRHQKEFSEMIMEGKEIKPVTVDKEREIDASKISKVDYFMAIEAAMPGEEKLPLLESWSMWLPRKRGRQKPN